MTYCCLRYLWPCIRREFIIQALKIVNGPPKAIKDISSKPKSLKLL
jgi:hypothetical protein